MTLTARKIARMQDLLQPNSFGGTVAKVRVKSISLRHPAEN